MDVLTVESYKGMRGISRLPRWDEVIVDNTNYSDASLLFYDRPLPTIREPVILDRLLVYRGTVHTLINLVEGAAEKLDNPSHLNRTLRALSNGGGTMRLGSRDISSAIIASYISSLDYIANERFIDGIEAEFRGEYSAFLMGPVSEFPGWIHCSEARILHTFVCRGIA